MVPRTSGPRHPRHDDVSAAVRSWFTTSAPDIGYEVERTWFGYLGRLAGRGSRAILDIDDAASVPAALADALTATPGGSLLVWVDDRGREAALDQTLQDAGCRRGDATTHLALVGHIDAEPGPPGLTIERADPAEKGFEEWATVKIQAFGDSESSPPPEQLEGEITVRRAEAPLAAYALARLDGESVGVLGWYTGHDQLVFNLGTRLPCRHRGIAQAMLRHWAEAGEQEQARLLAINATEGGGPERLYRRLGFADEIYWYRQYAVSATGPG